VLTPHSSDTEQDLETAFGDPYDARNPYGYEAITGADEQATPFEQGKRMLDAWGMAAEFVPQPLGGRLADVDALVRRLRPVFRRDAALGLSHGLSSFMAALNVWLGGSTGQQKSLAGKLLAGTKLCLVDREPEHRHDLAFAELTAYRRGGAMVLDGRDELIHNAEGAHSAMIVARTADSPPDRTHSLLLVDLAGLPPTRWRQLPRVSTMGLRGCQFGGLAFSECPIPGDSFVGEPGAGAATASRTRQVSGCVTAGLALGMLDAGLFTVLRFALDRRLYGQTVAEIPHARSAIAGAFADLITADCLATTAARALHVLPDYGGVYAAAATYLVPLLLEAAMNELSVVLGARFYLREGEHAIFGKHFRDLPALGVVYPNELSDRLTMLRHLPTIGRALRRSPEPPAAVFDQDTELPSIALGDPRPGGQRSDPLLASLALYLPELDEEASGDPDLAVTTALLRTELRKLVKNANDLPTSELSSRAGADSLALTEGYATLLAASACVGVWRSNRRRRVLADTAWISMALHRLIGRLVPGLPPCPPHLDEALFTELLTRARGEVGFCLDEDRVVRTLLH
jgi:alkylation response protein AidB-like acyl-CoA dehydrogenase